MYGVNTKYQDRVYGGRAPPSGAYARREVAAGPPTVTCPLSFVKTWILLRRRGALLPHPRMARRRAIESHRGRSSQPREGSQNMSEQSESEGKHAYLLSLTEKQLEQLQNDDIAIVDTERERFVFVKKQHEDEAIAHLDSADVEISVQEVTERD